MANETIADIIAEKRRRAEEIERNCAEMMKSGMIFSDCYARDLVADIRREADRLEAAHKRERGDFAELREALKNSNGLLEELAAIGKWGESAREQIAENKAALAAPPRNCDRPECATSKAAQAVWRKEDGGRTAYHVWLLAPATERKGGNDGNE